jgi:hypothetical protein
MATRQQTWLAGLLAFVVALEAFQLSLARLVTKDARLQLVSRRTPFTATAMPWQVLHCCISPGKPQALPYTARRAKNSTTRSLIAISMTLCSAAAFAGCTARSGLVQPLCSAVRRQLLRSNTQLREEASRRN